MFFKSSVNLQNEGVCFRRTQAQMVYNSERVRTNEVKDSFIQKNYLGPSAQT